jgi:hypothetical protein
MDDEVSVSGTGRRYRASLSRVAAGDSDEQGDEDLCWINQPGSCAYANRHTAADIGIAGGAVSLGEEFTPAADGVPSITKEVLGSASVGQRVLGSIEWECDR